MAIMPNGHGDDGEEDAEGVGDQQTMTMLGNIMVIVPYNFCTFKFDIFWPKTCDFLFSL